MIKPIFTSCYSVGKSILTLKESESEEGSDSIISICKEEGLTDLVLVEDNMTSFMKAFHACNKNNIRLTYGLRLSLCNNSESENKDDEHKGVVFALDDEGCKLLNKIYSCAFTEGGGKINYNNLLNLWDSKHLSFVVPFYGSFIHENNFFLKNCIPYLDGLNPRFWIERNNLPFDSLLEDKVRSFIGDKYPCSLVKTIKYKNKEDVEALQTYKVLCNRSFGRQATLSNPNLSHFGSDEFCWE